MERVTNEALAALIERAALAMKKMDRRVAQRALREALRQDGWNLQQCHILSDRLISEARKAGLKAGRETIDAGRRADVRNLAGK